MDTENTLYDDTSKALDPVTNKYISVEEWAKKYNDKTILEVQIAVPQDDGTARIDIRYMSATEYLQEYGNAENPPKATIHSQGATKPTAGDLNRFNNAENELKNLDA